MCKPRYFYAPGFALVLAGVLGGCAAYSKCGFRGCPGDAKITAEVRAQLDQYPALGGPNSVRVQTVDNVVYLYGQVDTDMQRQLAESVAVQATGGAQVVDSISLSNASR
ncbi:MAG: BON domain-containing protein [Steroidobacterales bacterium]